MRYAGVPEWVYTYRAIYSNTSPGRSFAAGLVAIKQ